MPTTHLGLIFSKWAVLTVLAGLFGCVQGLFAQTMESHGQSTEIIITFELAKSAIDSSFGDNASCLQQVLDIFEEVEEDSLQTLIGVTFCGSASPEGTSRINRRLSRERMLALEAYVRGRVSIPDSLVTYDDNYIPWDWLADKVEYGCMRYKNEVLAIIRDPVLAAKQYNNFQSDARSTELMKLRDGEPWTELKIRYFEQMRCACTIVLSYKKVLPPEPESAPEPEPEQEPESEPEIVPEPEPVSEVFYEPEWERRIYVKTNALSWPLLVSSAGVELDIARHWSATVPLLYSGLNYFTSKVKFRTFSIQPEVRYWFNEGLTNDGWFAGAHFGLSYYNLALNGDNRIQDHDGDSPAIGGGVAVGYRMPIGGRWSLEFAFGLGVYDLHYDKFENVSNGQVNSTVRKTYFGPDQAAVSFVYSFDWNRQR